MGRRTWRRAPRKRGEEPREAPFKGCVCVVCSAVVHGDPVPGGSVRELRRASPKTHALVDLGHSLMVWGRYVVRWDQVPGETVVHLLHNLNATWLRVGCMQVIM